MDSTRRAGLILGIGLLAFVMGVSAYVYGTTTSYRWVSFGLPSTLPPPRPLSLQVLRGFGVILSVAGLVTAALATHQFRRLRGVPR